MIHKCDCKSEYQDKAYGSKNRVHNIGKAPGKDRKKLVCTVCTKSKIV